MNNTEGRQRMIVFVAGGLTYSEIRCAYTVGQALGKEIFIGEPMWARTMCFDGAEALA